MRIFVSDDQTNHSASDQPNPELVRRQGWRVNATLFGESASRVVVSVREDRRDALMALARDLGVPAAVIGQTGGSRVTLRVDGRVVVDVDAAMAEKMWATAIESRMQGR